VSSTPAVNGTVTLTRYCHMSSNRHTTKATSTPFFLRAPFFPPKFFHAEEIWCFLFVVCQGKVHGKGGRHLPCALPWHTAKSVFLPFSPFPLFFLALSALTSIYNRVSLHFSPTPPSKPLFRCRRDASSSMREPYVH
jgi:hypothetical protein